MGFRFLKEINHQQSNYELGTYCNKYHRYLRFIIPTIIVIIGEKKDKDKDLRAFVWKEEGHSHTE